ncbi:hypothetical protein [Shewanella sp. S1-58-MNA-CIBAN-0166]|uniref:hypothetical protein n=1 Tax=Shewanella sp. S1-58-MNA-CIBAN-0166 TaxID=3140467 RepID=UPI00332E1B63|tara:strand:- start:1731 stop:2477 length:747 start_codon:yes stop_codon:yes gene_type:complete
MKEIPFYLDWQFWSAVAAVAALVLSQLPPVKLLFKKGVLTIEKHGTIFIHHTIGSPNINLFVILKNIGGSSISVHSIDMNIIRKSSTSFLLKGRGYANNPSDYNFVMLTPFEIEPNQTWAHTISFVDLWNRAEQKEYKAIYSNIRDTITEKNRVDPGYTKRHEADESDYIKICNFFEKNYKWIDGEYDAEILVKDKENNVIAKDKVKFTLFESESDELRLWVEDYKYGNSIHLPVSQKQYGVWVDLSD